MRVLTAFEDVKNAGARDMLPGLSSPVRSFLFRLEPALTRACFCLLADHQHWQRLDNALDDLETIGINNVWIPPACKASKPENNGYDIYDLYDLGEFDAKGSIATKWGTKKELLGLCNRAREMGIGICFDAVLNHRAGADHFEKCQAVKINPNGRDLALGATVY